MNDQRQLSNNVKRQAKRMKKMEKERPTLLAQTIFLGTLGLVFVLPVVAGAYIGRWLDGMAEGYSTLWTLSLLVLGIIIGFFNVYLMVRENK